MRSRAPCKGSILKMFGGIEETKRNFRQYGNFPYDLYTTSFRARRISAATSEISSYK